MVEAWGSNRSLATSVILQPDFFDKPYSNASACTLWNLPPEYLHANSVVRNLTPDFVLDPCFLDVLWFMRWVLHLETPVDLSAVSYLLDASVIRSSLGAMIP